MLAFGYGSVAHTTVAADVIELLRSEKITIISTLIQPTPDHSDRCEKQNKYNIKF